MKPVKHVKQKNVKQNCFTSGLISSLLARVNRLTVEHVTIGYINIIEQKIPLSKRYLIRHKI